MLVTRDGDLVCFEIFELTPDNSAIMTARGRLVRTFPAQAIAIPVSVIQKDDVVDSLAETIGKMSSQTNAIAQPTAKKAGSQRGEVRQSTNPCIVTDYLSSVLLALGSAVEVPAIEKKMREEVMYLSCLIPWTRSQTWLLFRAAMHLVSSRLEASVDSQDAAPRASVYKEFVAYLMTRLLKEAHQHEHDLDSDLLSVMTAKISRRLRKMGETASEWLRGYGAGAIKATNKILTDRWKKTCARDARRPNFEPLAKLDFRRDTVTKMAPLDDYLQRLRTLDLSASTAPFEPSCRLATLKDGLLPRVSVPSDGYRTFHLAGFEAWVETSLDGWLRGNISSSTTCTKLYDVLSAYHAAANSTYQHNPQATSIMVLTCLELWIACNKSALHLCPLLAEYHTASVQPDLILALVESLVLTHRAQLERLQRIEEYFDQCATWSRSNKPSVFTSFGDRNSFYIAYYTSSTAQQNLYDRIVRQAQHVRQQKEVELARAKAAYNRLKNEADRLSCEYREIRAKTGYYRTVHDWHCRKCQLKSQYEGMTITLHEWPLPQDKYAAQNSVFELQPPEWLPGWRDATDFLLQNVLLLPRSAGWEASEKHHLFDYPTLRQHVSGPSLQRIKPISEVKALINSHYNSLKIGSITSDSEILANHGPHYQYMNMHIDRFAGTVVLTDSLSRRCMYKLPAADAALQQFLYRPAESTDGPFPNTVIASQHECPQHMTLPEFRELCVLPLGYKLQWQNILRQLQAPSVDFKQLSTFVFIAQCVTQAGPRSKATFLRESHAILGDPVFSRELLDGVDAATMRIAESWQSTEALRACIIIAAGVLQMTDDPITINKCLKYFTSARRIGLDWAVSLRDEARVSDDAVVRDDFRRRAARCALVCSMAYDLDDNHMSSELQSTIAASQFLQCAMIAREGNDLPSSSGGSPDALLWCWQRICYRAMPFLSTNTIAGLDALDDAIKSSWSGHKKQRSWTTFSAEHREWLVGSVEEASSPIVHFNLLTGELLVNGLPLNRLPTDYESHPTYSALFGKSIIDVMPGTVPGYPFSTNVPYAGHDVQFALISSELFVRATKGDQVLHFVPRRFFSGTFPDAFADCYVHFYDEATHSISLRPNAEPWTWPRQPWLLKRPQADEEDDSWQLCKDRVAVVSLGTATSKALARILDAIEAEPRIHCFASGDGKELEIELPGLRSHFCLNAGERVVQCRDFRGMIVDEDQGVGTLVGLDNKLVLRSANASPTSILPERMVLVPNGHASTGRSSHHVRVRIQKPRQSPIHVYRVDALLGRLVDGGDLYSKIFLALLHALTASCVPDKLTSRTGTEEALRILRSAAIRSSTTLNKEAIVLLGQIASLTPNRAFYPAHLRVMQTMRWSDNLGFLAQHDDFVSHASAILEQAQNNSFFYEDHSQVSASSLYASIPRSLLARSQIRCAQTRVSTFGAETHTIHHDVTYTGRGRLFGSETLTMAYAVAQCLVQGTAKSHLAVEQDLASHLWDFLQNRSILNASSEFEAEELAYDAKWFLPWDQSTKSFIEENWLHLHCFLSDLGTRQHRQAVLTWLSSISCAKAVDYEIVHVLKTLFVSAEEMSKVQLPRSATQFMLSRGRVVKREQIRNIILKHQRTFSLSADTAGSQHFGETDEQYYNRQLSAWESLAEAATEELVTSLSSQWPCAEPKSLLATSDPACASVNKYFKPMVHDTGHAEICGLFNVWYENLQFFQYLQKVCAVVRRDPSAMAKPSQPMMPVLPLRPALSEGYVSVDELFSAAPPPMLPAASELPSMLAPMSTSQSSVGIDARARLGGLLGSLQTMATTAYRRSYVDSLEKSRTALDKGHFVPNTLSIDQHELRLGLGLHLTACQERVRIAYEKICAVMIGDIADFLQLPRVSPMLLLEQLSHKNSTRLSDSWKEVLVQYGLALTELQRAKRLINARGSALVKELQNEGHENWSPYTHPEWLLLEIEGGILIRNVQIDIATEMQNPTDDKNAVMQLNMGEGKSSVIVPMLVTALADGGKLMRVIVAKPQSKQMLQMLVSKLGGLVDRQVFHLPFSRAIKVGAAELYAIDQLLSSCRAEGGVLLVQPEHILSFQLMGIEKKISGDDATADQLLSLHESMRAHSRDVVDESDENFSPRFELVYSLGQQQPIDHAPERWTCIQEVLDVIRSCLADMQDEFPYGIDVREGSTGCFQRTRLIESKAADRLLDMLADKVCENGLMGFPILQCAGSVRSAVREYIRNNEASDEIIALVEQAPPTGFWTETTKNTLLLLRGLIANGVLAFAFGHKRWRVDYGLDTSRSPPTRLAVPYRAKDHPSARSEFSHPDVVIVLTCLSYYYQGLSNSQLATALNHLDRSDQRGDEYATWVKDANGLSKSLLTLTGVNLEDPELCSKRLFPCFTHSKAAVDYFLAHIVFTKEMKEFPDRLSASGWDIGEQTAHPTTGFSGTNDAQIVLPLSVTQTALPAQAHTNALVLQHLLQEENTVETIPSLQSTSRARSASPSPSSPQPSTNAGQLLDMIVSMDPPVRVILDVGAQIIELDNLEVAKKWLELLKNDSSIEAAVFVDQNDNIRVVDRKGRVESLYTSPYSAQLGLCVVFLDDAHTRGTDLKLPQDYRAAVTLGANLVKDRLVQGKCS